MVRQKKQQQQKKQPNKNRNVEGKANFFTHQKGLCWHAHSENKK